MCFIFTSSTRRRGRGESGSTKGVTLLSSWSYCQRDRAREHPPPAHQGSAAAVCALSASFMCLYIAVSLLPPSLSFRKSHKSENAFLLWLWIQKQVICTENGNLSLSRHLILQLKTNGRIKNEFISWFSYLSDTFIFQVFLGSVVNLIWSMCGMVNFWIQLKIPCIGTGCCILFMGSVDSRVSFL